MARPHRHDRLPPGGDRPTAVHARVGLESANIADKLMARLGGAETLGPILTGISKPVDMLQRGAAMDDIVNLPPADRVSG
jgi:malate dehydrogenase (oxaloacetate-decarboxylating)(NADP+)